MAVETKPNLLARHAGLKLQLVHAAIGTYPHHSRGGILSVNRLLFVFEHGHHETSMITDCRSGKRFPMRRGGIFFIPCARAIDMVLTGTLQFVSLQFNLDQFYGTDIFRNYPRCVAQERPKLVEDMKHLILRDDELITICRINEVIFHECCLLLEAQPEITSDRTEAWRNYGELLRFIEEHGDATTTVATLAKLKGVRQDCFSRAFTRDMDVTPKAFITRVLMRKASAMLQSPDTRIREVAEALNFSSEYYFSRFFKKHAGIPPLHFREMNGLGSGA